MDLRCNLWTRKYLLIKLNNKQKTKFEILFFRPAQKTMPKIRMCSARTVYDPLLVNKSNLNIRTTRHFHCLNNKMRDNRCYWISNENICLFRIHSSIFLDSMNRSRRERKRGRKRTSNWQNNEISKLSEILIKCLPLNLGSFKMWPQKKC